MSKKVRAKFKCTQVSIFEYGKVIGLKPSFQAKEENEDFSKETLAGEMQIQIDNKEGKAWDFFEAGGEYYLDISVAPATEVEKPKESNVATPMKPQK